MGSSGSLGFAGGGFCGVSQTAYVYDENNVAVGSVAGVLGDNGWVLYGADGEEYALPTNHYLVWKTEGVALSPPDPTILHYNREIPVSEPTSKPSNVANKGYAKQRLWTAQQFQNSGNSGSVDAGFHSLVVTDIDGIPTVNGEYAETNITAVSRTESAANGELVLIEGYLYSPIRYPDSASGKYVKKAELVDSYTGTVQADYSQLFISSDGGGNYSLDRSDLKLVSDGAQPGASIYTLDPSQRGEWVRFAYANGDMGGASQFNIQLRMTYSDGSIQTLALTNFLHQIGSLSYHAETALESLVFDVVSGAWTKDGDSVDVDTSLGNLKDAIGGQMPITYNTWNASGAVGFSGVFGGSGSGYEYSIDGGRTFQASPNFDLSGAGAIEIVPTVRDSNGTASGKAQLSTHFPHAARMWSADFATPAINDVDYDDGPGNRGWSIDYSNQIGGNHLESSNNADLTWSLNNSTQDTNYIYMGNTSASPISDAEADLSQLIAVAGNSQTYTVALNIYDYYHGGAGTISTFAAEVVDNSTSAILGRSEFEWAGDTTANLVNQSFSFDGAGNPVTLRLSISHDPNIIGDWWGSTTYATLTPDSIIKTAGTGWNTGIRSAKMRAVSDGISASFKPSGTGNCGMFGLDSDYASTSYGGVDYAFYISAGTSYGIYEDGSPKSSGAYAGGNNAVFSIDVATDGTVEYKISGTVVYTSATNAGDSSYWFAAHPYTSGHGVTDISFNGSDDVIIPDAAGHYVRIDNLRLFEGAYSDASHYAKKSAAGYLLFRGIDGKAVYLSKPHGYDKDVSLIPKFDIRPYGTLSDVIDRVTLEYQIDSGAWTTMLDHDGRFDINNTIYLSPFHFDRGVTLTAGESIRYRMTVYGGGDGAKGYYFYENSDLVRV